MDPNEEAYLRTIAFLANQQRLGVAILNQQQAQLAEAGGALEAARSRIREIEGGAGQDDDGSGEGLEAP